MMYLEGLEQQLVILQDAEEQHKADPKTVGNVLLACANCYQLSTFCSCTEKIFWPAANVITKIRWLLYRQVG